MSHNSKQAPQEEGGEGAPLWIISFADMISLLMAFFVMLSTFSSFGSVAETDLKRVGSATLMPNYGFYKWGRSGMGPEGHAALQTDRGSERPTLEKSGGSGSLAESEPLDFRTNKVFLIESGKIFWSKGVALSSNGKEFLNDLVEFLKKAPSRIVISERGPGENKELGISRAIVILEYLVLKGIPKDCCNIGMNGTVPEKNFTEKRMVEITLLDEGTYR